MQHIQPCHSKAFDHTTFSRQATCRQQMLRPPYMPGMVELVSNNTTFDSFGKILAIMHWMRTKHNPLPNLSTIQRLEQIFSEYQNCLT
jgi:hypothetical protein